MKISQKLNLTLAAVMLFAASCKKSGTEDMVVADQTISAKELSSVSALATPSTTNSMINYESYYVSAVDGLVHGYIISLPLDYNPDNATKYPLLVFLHGAGEKPSTDYDLAKLKANGPHKEIFSKRRAFPAVIVSIQMEKWAPEIKPEVVKEFIDILTGVKTVGQKTGAGRGLTSYKIDLGKINLTGLSQGGASVYKTAFTYPNLFASISVFAGYTGSQANMSLIKIPAYLRHNSGDATVGVTNAYNAQRWIDAAKPSETVNLLVYNKTGHDAWSTPYASEELYTWTWNKSRTVSTPPAAPVEAAPTAPVVIAPVVTAPVVIAPVVTAPVAITPVVTPPVVTAPVISAPVISSLYPANNSIISKPSSGYISLDMIFSKNIKKGSGLIQVKNVTKNTIYNAYASWAMVSVAGSKASVYPMPVEAGSTYVVTVVSGAFKDESGLAFAGITNTTTWTFSVK